MCGRTGEGDVRESVYHPFISAQQLVKSSALSVTNAHRSPLPDTSPPFSQLRHHLEQLASLMGGIASKLATMKRQIMSGRVLAGERGWVGGRREELEYLNNLAPRGCDDSSVILK